MKLKLVLIGLIIAGINHCTHAIEPEREPATRYSAMFVNGLSIFGNTKLDGVNVSGDIKVVGPDAILLFEANSRVDGNVYLIGQSSKVGFSEGVQFSGNIYLIGEGAGLMCKHSERSFHKEYIDPKVFDHRDVTRISASQPISKYEMLSRGNILVYDNWHLRDIEVIGDIEVVEPSVQLYLGSNTLIFGNIHLRAEGSQIQWELPNIEVLGDIDVAKPGAKLYLGSNTRIRGNINLRVERSPIQFEAGSAITETASRGILNEGSLTPDIASAADITEPQNESNLPEQPVSRAVSADPIVALPRQAGFLRRLAWCCS